VIADVVTVGGGIVGCACASELATAGLNVLLLERGPLVAGASGRNQGLLQPQAERRYHAMFQEAVGRYEHLAEEGRIPLRLRETGQILVADADTLADTRRAAARFAEAGLPVDWLEPERLRAAEPSLAPGLAGGFLLAGVRTIDPAAATIALAQAAREAGATVRTFTRVWRLLRQGRRVVGVLTEAGPVAAGAVLVAAGWASGELLATAGVSLPVAGARGWLLRTAPLPWRMRFVLGEAEWHGGKLNQFPTLGDLERRPPGGGSTVAFTLQQARSGHATIGATALSTVHDGPDTSGAAVRDLTVRALRFVPGLAKVPVGQVWSGVRPVTPHGDPLIGPVPGVEGLWVAAGHGGQGVMLAPATGRMLAEYLTAGNAHGAEPFRPVLR
jgi:sarcosine oxidase subunit beta